MAIKSKQIEKNLSASIQIAGFSAAGADDVVTSAITTALSTAGNGGVSVPLQVSSNIDTIGVITASPNNRVEIWDNTTKDKIVDSSGEEVYGRITESGGVYTLTYYSLNASTGVETAYSFGNTTSIDFEFNYRFDFARFPTDAPIAVGARNVTQDPGGSGKVYTEKLNVTAQNTIADLAKTPTATSNVMLYINGVVYDTFATASFSVSGKAITWSAANSGFNVETTDRVVAKYTTNE